MLKAIFVPAAVAIAALLAVPASASAAEQKAGVRNGDQIRVSAPRKHKNKVVRHAASHQIAPQDRPWTGSDTDLAGNSFTYYRTGIGTPFASSRGIRGRF